MTDFSSKRIGILGGLGAAASVRLHTFLVEECQRRGVKNDWEFPEILHYSLSPRSMDHSGVTDSEQLIRELNAGIAILEEWSADSILVACNSVFAHIDKIVMARHERIVNIPEIARQHCIRQEAGVICSQSSQEDGLYPWAKHIDRKDRQTINRVIRHVVRGAITAQDEADLYGIVYDLWNTDCEIVILGCTELALAMPERPKWVVDAAELAVKEVLN
jgi:aspartate/glutamate racemase